MKLLMHLSEYMNLRVWFISVGLMVIFMVAILPHEAQRYASVSNQLPAPDTQVFYTADWLHQLARDLGEEGRMFYILSRLRFDIIWPLVFAFFFFSSIALLFHKSPFKKYLIALPVFALAFDYLENSFVSIVFWIYPTTIDILATLAALFTLFKWLSIGITVVVILIGLIIGVYLRLKTIKNDK